MSERYTKLFALAENLYTEGSPAVISAGALLKDNQTGKVLVQLKIKNIGAAVIKAAKVSIQPLDTVGAKLGGEVGYTYLDLSASRDAEFGQKTLIPMPDKETRGFEVRLTEAVFADNTVWKENGGVWESLPAPKSIDTIGDAELVKQYRIKYGLNSTVCPMKVKDLWYCNCGALNSKDENCYKCGKSFAELNAVDMEALKAERDERLATEKAEAERKTEEARIAAEKAAKKRNKVASIVIACVAAVLLVSKVIIPNGKYKDAVALMNDGKYEEAISAFESLTGYKDSAEQITACQTAIKDNEYEAAVALMNDGKYDEAISAFESLTGYKDSKDKILECLFFLQKPNLSGIRKGDTIRFGFYEQDNNTVNGKEEIEWIVLSVEKSRALVISKYALDCQQYNTSYTDVTWEKCPLRKWLNDSFLNTAFTAKHQELIPSVSVSADKNPEYSTNPGNSTNDKVFLLSIMETEKYFSSDSARQCSATAYAKAQGAYTNNRNGNCWWWLRSPGLDARYAANVASSGKCDNAGEKVDVDDSCVRPALWISLC